MTTLDKVSHQANCSALACLGLPEVTMMMKVHRIQLSQAHFDLAGICDEVIITLELRSGRGTIWIE